MVPPIKGQHKTARQRVMSKSATSNTVPEYLPSDLGCLESTRYLARVPEPTTASVSKLKHCP